MGNNSSHKRTKVPKQALKERPPDMDRAWPKQQFFNHLKWKKPSDAAGTPLGSQAAAPTLQGAGDGAERRESARGRETKTILVKLLLLLGARLQQEKRRVAGGPGAGGGAKAAQGWRWLIARLLTESKAGRYAYPA
ncbi:uncharacterized protein C20orf144 homolog [Neophocaena asiaeorientalis asiaeorientalis]|uniref:Uncharacterized protein C20orf144 homolog n=1 Tax=Neophocaena asiaeorientalis asiaeorientalis TaxID=1706337 RepID=A0A341B9F2_NEOAA|nr:uncharacterized protein C20orf144 homolog [Neophocaena asiaeorientalis asiaeorientalis]